MGHPEITITQHARADVPRRMLYHHVLHAVNESSPRSNGKIPNRRLIKSVSPDCPHEALEAQLTASGVHVRSVSGSPVQQPVITRKPGSTSDMKN